MSSWPLTSDFSRTLKTPKVAFRDPDLRDLTIEVDNVGQPKARSGNFATVYKGLRSDGSELAIRVFNRKGDERRERYDIVNRYIKGRNVLGLVGFHYDEKGIRSASDNRMYPLLTMDWVPGVTLFEWCRDRCHEGYTEALSIGAEAWLELVRDLGKHDLVHGDLQHGNILISREGRIKLVDYDCMAVPELMNMRNLEIGLPPYQHPGRDESTLMFPGMDNYSALFIYVALRALAAAPHLWFTYVDQTGYDKLLFKATDFENPHGSPLYHELMNSTDDQVRDLTHYLFQLRGYRLQDVPPIDEVLLWCHNLGDLLTARDFDLAVQLADRMGPNEPIAPELQPALLDARQRVACREELEKAIDDGDEQRIQQYYQPHLIDDYPSAAHLVEAARLSPQVTQALGLLQRALEYQSWDVFRATWQANEGLLTDRPSARKYKAEITKLRTVDTLRQFLKDVNSDDARVLAVWKELQAQGGHPLAEPLKPYVQQRVNRQSGQAEFQKLIASIPEIPNAEYDKKLLLAWKSGVAGQSVLASHQHHFAGAKKRLTCLKRFKEIFDDKSLESENEIVNIGKELPPTYHPKLRRRLQMAEDRVKHHSRLVELLESPESELDIVDRWRNLERAGGQDLMPEEDRWRVHLAMERAPLIKALRMIDDKLTPEQRDERVLRVWKDDLLSSCQEALPWRKLYQRATARKQALEELQHAMEAGDMRTVERLRADPLWKSRPLSAEMEEQIAQAAQQAGASREQRRNALKNCLVDNRRSEFADLFDTEIVRDICQQYHHHEPVVGQWLENDLLGADQIGLTVPNEGGLTKVDDTTWRAVWVWPPDRITRQCRLAVCKEPPAGVSPDDLSTQFSATIDQDDWKTGDAAGFDFQIEEEWRGSFVYVWAVVDMGFQVYFSEPVQVGQIEPKKKRWGLFRG